MTSREPLPVCLAALCLGIVVDKTISVPAFVWGTLFFVLGGIWMWYYRHASQQSPLKSKPPVPIRGVEIEKRRLFRSTMVLLGFIAVFGGLWHHQYWNVYSRDDPGLFLLDQPTPVVLEGTVISSPRWFSAPPKMAGRLIPASDMTVLTLRVTQVRNGIQWEPAHGRISVSVVGKLSDVHYGDSLRLVGKLSHPNKPHNPGDYDQATALRQQRILTVLRVDGRDSVTKLKSGSISIARCLESLRNSARANIAQYMKPEHAGFAAAMILGVREEIDPELSQLLLESGVAHIIAISGLHVGLVALGFIVLLRLLGLRRKPFAVVLALMLLFYLCLTDMRPSAIRATLLVFVACLSIFRGQRRMQINAFAATGFVVLLLNPTSLFQLGTQLSFLATSVFLWFGQVPDIFSMVFERHKVLNMLAEDDKQTALGEMADNEKLLANREWLRVLLGYAQRRCRRLVNNIMYGLILMAMLWLVTSPLVASQMHIFSLIGLLINPLLWMPLSLALLSGFGVMIFGWFCPPLAVVFGWCTNASYTFLTNMIAWFHVTPGGFYWVAGFSTWWLIGLYVPFLVMSLFPQLRPKKRWLVIAAASWLLVAFTVHYVRQWDDRRNDRLYVRILSVGHGLCVHIKTPDGKAILYDVGSMSSPHKSANIAAHSLWDVGSRKIDTIVISHPDSDHYNGLVPLLDKLCAEAVYVTPFMFQKEGEAIDLLRETLSEQGIPVTTLTAGDVIDRLGYPMITVLHPPEPVDMQMLVSPESNANSLMLLIEHRGHRILLPGDIESNQRLALTREPPVHVDVMMSPHHGSVKNTADELVAWATPDYLVISGGLFTYNPQSKPHFEESGCHVLETLKNGMIEVIIDRQGICVRSRR